MWSPAVRLHTFIQHHSQHQSTIHPKRQTIERDIRLIYLQCNSLPSLVHCLETLSHASNFKSKKNKRMPVITLIHKRQVPYIYLMNMSDTSILFSKIIAYSAFIQIRVSAIQERSL